MREGGYGLHCAFFFLFDWLLVCRAQGARRGHPIFSHRYGCQIIGISEKGDFASLFLHSVAAAITIKKGGDSFSCFFLF